VESFSSDLAPRPRLVFESRMSRFLPDEQGFRVRVFHGPLGHIGLITGAAEPLRLDPDLFFNPPTEDSEDSELTEVARELLDQDIELMNPEDRGRVEQRIAEAQFQASVEDAVIEDAEWGFFTLGMPDIVMDALCLGDIEEVVWITESVKTLKGRPEIRFSRIMLPAEMKSSVEVRPMSIEEVSLLSGLPVEELGRA